MTLYKRVMAHEGYAYIPVDLEDFYKVLDRLHTLAFDSNDPALVNAIAKEKLKLIEANNAEEQ